MSEIQIETIKTWMVRYYKGEEKAVLYDDHLAKVEKERLRERQALVCEIDSRVEEITKLRELIVGAIEAIEVLRLLGKLTGHETSITDAWLFSAKAAMKEKDEEIAQWKRVVVTHVEVA